MRPRQNRGFLIHDTGASKVSGKTPRGEKNKHFIKFPKERKYAVQFLIVRVSLLLHLAGLRIITIYINIMKVKLLRLESLVINSYSAQQTRGPER